MPWYFIFIITIFNYLYNFIVSLITQQELRQELEKEDKNIICS